MTAAALLLIWLVLARAVTPGLIVSGVLVVAIAMWLVPRQPGPRLLWWRLPRLVIDEIVGIARATWGVAVQTATPGSPTPVMLDVRIPEARPSELMWLATLLTLTPGTYVVDVEPDRGRMKLHLLDADRVEDAAADVRRLDADVRALFGDDPAPLTLEPIVKAPT